MASEMITPLLPIFLTATLGALWQWLGEAAAFLAAAGLTCVSMAILVGIAGKGKKP